ncbi:MAG: MlaE family lipid ABC transporter permease subunit [Pseudomonadota bacterium]
MKNRPSDYTLSILEDNDHRVTLLISGRMDLRGLGSLNTDMEAFWTDRTPARITADLSGVQSIDSAGAMMLLRLEERAKAAGIPFEFLHVSEPLRGVMGLLNMKALRIEPLLRDKESEGIFHLIGATAERQLEDFRQVMTFVGELLTALVHVIRRPRVVRWNAVFLYMQKVGVDGFPIVTLISLLIGVIMAFMSSLQLKQFGATTYVAPLVAFAMVRELGPMMTAILVAGRSGSAFSAEIGSMIINEEVDALATMGFDPVQFLAIPKVLASIVVVPLLAVYSALFGIIGGMMVGILGLDLTANGYLQQSINSFGVFDVVSSLIKSIVFAILISGIACQRGFQVRGGADAVGEATTSAVVSAIFLIILANSAFAIILYYIR